MSTFTVYSAGCPRCGDAVSTLKSAIANRGCGCTVQEVSCDGHCDQAKRLGFEGKSRPIITRDDGVVHEGPLSAAEAMNLLPIR